MRAAVEAAHARGLRVAAHVGHVVTVEQATRIGVDAFEHVRIGPELLDEQQRHRVASLPPRRHDHLMSFRPWRYADLSSRAVDQFVGLLVERGVHLTPTLVLSQSILRGNAAEVVDAPAARQMDDAILARWEASRYSADFSDDDWSWAPTELARQLAFIGLAHERGVPIVAGTDTPNPYVPPGASLHSELRLLLRAGLPPAQVISAATQRGARLLNIESRVGTVEKGKVADVVVVAGDPFAAHGDFDDIEWVLMAGEIVVARGRPRQPADHAHRERS